MASIEGGNNGVSGIGPGQSGSGSDGISAAEMASNLIGSSTGPAGLETNRLAASVDMAMQSISDGTYQGTGLTDGFSAADLEAAVMSQLGPRQQGQFQSSLDTYKASPFTTAAQQLAVDLPFQLPVTSSFRAVGTNADGHPINSCGDVVPEQTFMSSTDTPAYRMAEMQREQQQTALENIDRIRGGPISGPATAIAVIAGAEQRTIELVHGLGQTLDGLAEPWSP